MSEWWAEPGRGFDFLDGGYDRELVEDCEYHPAHNWTVIRVGDAKPHTVNPDERLTMCRGCFVPRCGDTEEANPCVLPRHHRERHLYADGTEEPDDVWPGNKKPDPPRIALVRPAKEDE